MPEQMSLKGWLGWWRPGWPQVGDPGEVCGRRRPTQSERHPG